MARFTFNMRSHGGLLEVEQIDLPDVAAARREALQACSDLLREIADLHVSDAWELEVLDRDGRRICLLKFTAETGAGGDGREPLRH